MWHDVCTRAAGCPPPRGNFAAAAPPPHAARSSCVTRRSTPSRGRRLWCQRADACCSARCGHLSLAALLLQRASPRPRPSLRRSTALPCASSVKQGAAHARVRAGSDARTRASAVGALRADVSALQGAGQLSAVLSTRQGREGHDAGHVPCHGLPSPLPGPAGAQHVAAAGVVDDATPAFSKATRAARVPEGRGPQKTAAAPERARVARQLEADLREKSGVENGGSRKARRREKTLSLIHI